MAETPDYFDQDPVLVDLTPVKAADTSINFESLIAMLRNHHMVPVAARGGGPEQMRAARAAGLCLAPDAPARAERAGTKPADALSEGAAASVTSATAVNAIVAEPTIEIREVIREVVREIEVPVSSLPTLVVDKPLRSGQQVYARGADLIVLAAVSFGAEVMADGNIHVYAPLRGRALAGVQGDTNARIFTTCLEPQLISIAGIYRTTEVPIATNVVGKPAQVRLVGEKIIIDPI